jgi:peptidoglycan/LPS O-acetylase OafA/YrhL
MRLFIADIGYVVLPALYGLLIVAAAGLDLEGKSSLLRHRIMVTLGQWSFALYLIHATIIYAFVNQLGARPRIVYSNIGWLVIISLVCIAASGVLYKLVEHPVEKRLRGMLPPQARPAPDVRHVGNEPAR